jgi:hypothetical protein
MCKVRALNAPKEISAADDCLKIAAADGGDR